MTATTSTPRTGRQYAIRGTGPAGQGGAAPPSSATSDNATYLMRWMKVWIALLTVVTLVVVVYLVAITGSLASINKNLATADTAVRGAGGDTKTLPDQVQKINSNLTAIDTALKPIPGQADTIINDLSSIDTSLNSTDASLVDTSGSLVSTSGQLVDTASILTTVLAQGTSIRTTLFNADQPNGPCGATSCGADQLGVQNIHQRVAIANDVLDLAKGDTTNIIGGLDVVNLHLSSICTTTSILRLGAGSCPR
ncbi:MAG: hypothetical protein ABIV94_11770 [Acidimicrobiales bacterium]